MSESYDLYELEFADRRVYFLFYEIKPPYKNSRGNDYKHSLKLKVFFKNDDKEVDDDYLSEIKKDNNNLELGFHEASIDVKNNIYGHVAKVASFTSASKEEKKAMKGLGKLMLCTMTRYLVDSYGIDLDTENHMYYAEAGAGTPYFYVNPVHKLYHPDMCTLTKTDMRELIYPITTESGRYIPPVLSDEELYRVLRVLRVLDIDEEKSTESSSSSSSSSSGPPMSYFANDILMSEDRGKFIRACIQEIYPMTWKDIERTLKTPESYQKILEMLKKEKGIDRLDLDEYYESVMCEIIATHRLLNYYQNELAFEPYNKKDGRLVRIRAYLTDRLEKCDMTEKVFDRKEEDSIIE